METFLQKCWEIYLKNHQQKMTIEWPILDLRVWCLDHDIDYQELRELNPWILGYTLPGGAWDIKLFVR